MPQILMVAAAVSALAAIAADWRETHPPLFKLLKPLTTALIIALAWLAPESDYRTMLLIGLALSLIGEGDLSQELGYPRQYEHPVVVEAMTEIVETCKKNKVVVGHPHAEVGNSEKILKAGYTFLMCAPTRSYANLQAAQKLTGRA